MKFAVSLTHHLIFIVSLNLFLQCSQHTGLHYVNPALCIVNRKYNLTGEILTTSPVECGIGICKYKASTKNPKPLRLEKLFRTFI